MKKFLVTSHRWVGFPIGILFVVLFGTGFITAIDELLIRFNDEQTSHSFTYRQTSIEEDANFLTRFTKNKQNLSRAFMPTRSSPYYQLASRNERWLYSIDTPNTEFHQIKQDNEFFKTILQLHRNFLLGKEGFGGIEGKHYAAWVGLIALILSLIGLWIWWPRRKLFNIKDTLPRGKKRKQLYGNHTSAGVISVIAILMLALTGASITYRTFTKDLLGITEDQQPPKSATFNSSLTTSSVLRINNNWQSWLNAAYQQMPQGSTLVQINYPRKSKNKADESKNSQILSFRFITPNTWFSLAQSSVSIDIKQSKITTVRLFSNLSINEKIYTILKPLHTGHGLPTPYVFLLFAFSLVGTLMVLSGVVMFITKKRKKILFSQKLQEKGTLIFKRSM